MYARLKKKDKDEKKQKKEHEMFRVYIDGNNRDFGKNRQKQFKTVDDIKAELKSLAQRQNVTVVDSKANANFVLVGNSKDVNVKTMNGAVVIKLDNLKGRIRRANTKISESKSSSAKKATPPPPPHKKADASDVKNNFDHEDSSDEDSIESSDDDSNENIEEESEESIEQGRKARKDCYYKMKELETKTNEVQRQTKELQRTCAGQPLPRWVARNANLLESAQPAIKPAPSTSTKPIKPTPAPAKPAPAKPATQPAKPATQPAKPAPAKPAPAKPATQPAKPVTQPAKQPKPMQPPVVMPVPSTAAAKKYQYIQLKDGMGRFSVEDVDGSETVPTTCEEDANTMRTVCSRKVTLPKQ